MSELDGAVSATARAFWLYQGIAVAVVLLATAPDRTRTYEAAIGEIAEAQKIKIAPENIVNYLKTQEPQRKALVSGAIQEGARQAGLSVSPRFGVSPAFGMDPEPGQIDFSTMRIGDLVRYLDKEAPNQVYFVRFPLLTATQAAEELGTSSGMLMEASVSCDADKATCAIDAIVDPDGRPGDITEYLQIFTSFETVNTGRSPFDAIRFYFDGKADEKSWRKMSATRDVIGEIANDTPAEAIRRLGALKETSQQSVSAFGISFSGITARLIAPVALAALAMFAWSHAMALRTVALRKPAKGDILFLPLLRNPPAAAGRPLLFAFPLLVSYGALLQAVAINGLVGAVSILCLGVQAFATIALFVEFDGIRRARNS